MAQRELTQGSASAPALNGTAGSAIAVLDYCLLGTLGWTKAYTGTNKAVYRSGDATDVQHYLRVDDTAGKYIIARAYESMSGIDTGTNPYPTVAQRADAFVCYKSNTADGTARNWYFNGTGKQFILIMNHFGQTVTNNAANLYFGAFKSRVPGDAYNSILIGDGNSGTGGAPANTTDMFTVTSYSGYIARGYNQSTLSVAATCPMSYAPIFGGSGGLYHFGGNQSYPDVASGKAIVTPMYLYSQTIIRGRVLGIFDHCQTNAAFPDPLTNFDGLSGYSLRPRLIRSADLGDTKMLIQISPEWA